MFFLAFLLHSRLFSVSVYVCGYFPSFFLFWIFKHPATAVAGATTSWVALPRTAALECDLLQLLLIPILDLMNPLFLLSGCFYFDIFQIERSEFCKFDQTFSFSIWWEVLSSLKNYLR